MRNSWVVLYSSAGFSSKNRPKVVKAWSFSDQPADLRCVESTVLSSRKETKVFTFGK